MTESSLLQTQQLAIFMNYSNEGTECVAAKLGGNTKIGGKGNYKIDTVHKGI